MFARPFGFQDGGRASSLEIEVLSRRHGDRGAESVAQALGEAESVAKALGEFCPEISSSFGRSRFDPLLLQS